MISGGIAWCNKLGRNEAERGHKRSHEETCKRRLIGLGIGDLMEKVGAPGANRTPNPQLRSLYKIVFNTQSRSQKIEFSSDITVKNHP